MTTAVDSRTPADGIAGPRARAPKAGPRRRLFAKYAAALVGLVSLVLLINASLNVWFSYDEAKDAAVQLQHEKADAAAQRIETFIDEIERQIGWTTATQWASSPIEQRRFDYSRLLRQVPAITELSQLDSHGHEQLRVSRLSMDVVGSNTDYSTDPRFTEALAKKVWFGPVYFRKESEPYMTMAVAQSGRNAGVTVAEVNLKLIWDVITAIKIGKTGYAYVVDDKGRLIAHPDISRVLRNTDVSGLPQVTAARGTPAAAGEQATIVRNLDGHRVLSASAAIPRLGWLVFVEQPIGEALAPLYTSLRYSGLLLVLGLFVAILAGLLLARRMTGPIRVLDAGAARIGAGALDHRITVHTGDELEELAERFNTMAADLQSSYADLEKKVEDRTAELKEALDQQTATAEVLGVINSSPGDLAPVFDAILDKALHLCEAAFGMLWTYNGDVFETVALRNVPDAYAAFIHGSHRPDSETAHGRIVRGERVVQIADVAADELYRRGDPHRRALVERAKARTFLAVSLRRDDQLVGVLAIYREEVRPYSDKQIALLQNFAAQAVIAMENARLITETREALEQQTATAEVLQVINSSPGDLTPVFEAVLEKALRLCESAFGILLVRDGDHFRTAALHGAPPGLAEVLSHTPREPGRHTAVGRMFEGEDVVQFEDMRKEPAYLSGDARHRALVELGGTRTYIAVALRKDDRLVGTIGAYRQEVRPFTEKQIALLQNFAAQAVIAMENVRLLTETREALEQQTATAEVLQVINSSPGDLAPVFDAILDKAMRLCEAAFGGLWTVDQDRYVAVAWRAVPEACAEFFANNAAVPGSATGPGRILRGERVVHNQDLASEEAYLTGDPARCALVDLGGARSALQVALLKDNIPVGVITIYRKEVRPFSEKQIALLQSFAAQAEIAMENARLLTETREALEQQTATAEVLEVINSSPGDLAPVFDAILDKAHTLCDVAHGSLQLYENGNFRAVATRGLPEPFDALLRRPREPDAVGARLLAGDRALQLVDQADAVAQSPSPDALGITNAQRAAGLRTVLYVALRKETNLLGFIGAGRSEARPFNDKEITLLENFAAQAVIAMENARLLGELRTRTAELARSVDELRLLSEVGQAVSSTLDLRAVLSTILTRSVGLTGADAGAIFRYNRAERAFRLVEQVGWDETLARSVGDLRIVEAETAMGEAAARRLPMQITDLTERPSAPLRDASLAVGFRSVLIVPLVGPERILGALVLQRRAVGEFPPETVRLMQTLASQSVLAIQNARLFREIAEKSEELALASQHKSQFLANMSHELRTPLNAILGYAELLVDGIYGPLPDRPKGVLERIQNNGRHLLALINDVLDLAKIEAGQLTLTLEDYTLPEVVRSVVTATVPLATAKGLKFTAVVQENMPMAHGDARRVSQVLLNLVGNAIKFTDEGEVEIRAMADKDRFVLTVRDTGPGIADADQERIFGEFQQIDNSNTRKKGGTGLGLAISKRMVEMQGGTISVESALGQGSTFRVVLPVYVDEMMEAAE